MMILPPALFMDSVPRRSGLLWKQTAVPLPGGADIVTMLITKPEETLRPAGDTSAYESFFISRANLGWPLTLRYSYNLDPNTTDTFTAAVVGSNTVNIYLPGDMINLKRNVNTGTLANPAMSDDLKFAQIIQENPDGSREVKFEHININSFKNLDIDVDLFDDMKHAYLHFNTTHTSEVLEMQRGIISSLIRDKAFFIDVLKKGLLSKIVSINDQLGENYNAVDVILADDFNHLFYVRDGQCTCPPECPESGCLNPTCRFVEVNSNTIRFEVLSCLAYSWCHNALGVICRCP